MPRRSLRLAAGALLALSLSGAGDSAGSPSADSPTSDFPAGRWSVAFANGVNEVCSIGDGGESTVEEPKRSSNGMAEFAGRSIVITFNDDRVERWTPVGERFVVEHWFPGSRLPVTSAVLGIAERAR
jgi:hypothetical protein